MTNDVRNPGPDLGQTQKCVGVKPVNGIPMLPPLNNQIFTNNIDIKDKKKPAQTHIHSKRPHTIRKMNNNSRIAWSMNIHS